MLKFGMVQNVKILNDPEGKHSVTVQKEEILLRYRTWKFWDGQQIWFLEWPRLYYSWIR